MLSRAKPNISFTSRPPTLPKMAFQWPGATVASASRGMPAISTAGTNCQNVPFGQGIGKPSIRKPATTMASTNSHWRFVMGAGAPL
jgi:hypothetical protein